jgi:hypothetical protein
MHNTSFRRTYLCGKDRNINKRISQSKFKFCLRKYLDNQLDWSTVLPEKLLVAQPVKKLTAFYRDNSVLPYAGLCTERSESNARFYGRLRQHLF